MSNKVAISVPVIGFGVVQLIKFIKLPFLYEVLLTLFISLPYVSYFSPNTKKDMCTQTDMEFKFILTKSDKPQTFFQRLLNFFRFW